MFLIKDELPVISSYTIYNLDVTRSRNRLYDINLYIEWNIDEEVIWSHIYVNVNKLLMIKYRYNS